MVFFGNKNHLVLNVYASGNYKYNVVRDEDLESNIEHNKTYRFGRIIYVDGNRIYNGCLKSEVMPEYDKIAKDFYENEGKNVNMLVPTIPYQ